jgi:prepilin-type N-terminal cleavage/methylation domain-containing protein
MSRLRDERGFSLLELLVSTTIMLVVLLGTLTAVEGFTGVHRRDEHRTAAQDGLRRGMDDLERRLRNLAAPSTTTRSIARATATDLVFETADPQGRWMRYCVDPTDPGVETGQADLWLQGSSTATVAPPSTACPDLTGWTTTTSVGQAVVNMRDGLRRPVFTYNWPQDGAGNAITTDTAAVTRITTKLWVDTNPGADPPEQRLASGVFLRNQNRAPIAAFVATPNGRGAILDAAASVDPDGRRLDYHWWATTPATVPADCRPPSPAPPGYLGTGIAPSVVFPVGAASPLTVTLCVVDPGGLVATASEPVSFS